MTSRAPPSKKRVTLRCERTGSRHISWYDPTPHAALDRLVRAACAVGGDEEYVLCDDDSTPLALSSSLPDGLVLELCYVAKPAAPQCAATAFAAGRSAEGGDATASPLLLRGLGLWTMVRRSECGPAMRSEYCDRRFPSQYCHT